MEALDDPLCQCVLGIARADPIGHGLPEQQVVVLRHRRIGMESTLPYISPGSSRTPIWFPSDLLIFRSPSSPGRIGMVSTDCWRIP